MSRFRSTATDLGSSLEVVHATFNRRAIVGVGKNGDSVLLDVRDHVVAGVDGVVAGSRLLFIAGILSAGPEDPPATRIGGIG